MRRNWVGLLPRGGMVSLLRDVLVSECYSRSPKNPSLQQFQKCSKSASVGS